MKLLIITQVVDKDHPILGFFHRWIEEFGKHNDEVHVICLQKGTYTFAPHIHVHSLGKEEGKGRLTYLWRFFTLSWQLRKQYTHVFVHMSQIYIILGAVLWRFLGKRIGLWYAHGTVTRSLKVAVRLADLVYTSTPQGLQIDTSKRKIVGQGIDFTRFTKHTTNIPDSTLALVTVGRIAPSKNIDTLLRACHILKSQGVSFRFYIIGEALIDAEAVYSEHMHELVHELDLVQHVVWEGSITQDMLPEALQSKDIFIHDGATQSLDKALLEAVSCGLVVISSNPAYAECTKEYAPQYLYTHKEHQALARCVQTVQELSREERVASMASVCAAIKQRHSIEGLIAAIMSHYKGSNIV
jgi:glycosyltransferase involved in cell wall biosynthesis